MKIRVLVSSCLALVLGVLPAAWGVQPGKDAGLPNLDTRQMAQTKPSPLAAKAMPSAAETALQQKVPNATVSKHEITGTPRWISAQQGFLTGRQGLGKGLSQQQLDAVSVDDPNRVVKAFVNEHSALFGHDATALDAAKISRDSVSPGSGLRTVAWQQDLDGIEVHGGILLANLTKNGELVTMGDAFVKSPATAAAKAHPNLKSAGAQTFITARKAAALAAANLGGDVVESELMAAEAPEGADSKQSLNSAKFSGPVYSQLVWLPMSEDAMRLCWRIIANLRTAEHTYMVLVDAETGEILLRNNLTVHASALSFNVFPSDSPSPFTPGYSNVTTLQPLASVTNRVILTYTNGALLTNASPLGWVTKGTNTSTRGNNVEAFLDRNNDMQPDVPTPAANSNGLFDFPIDLGATPLSYASASTVQLFWRANWFHDRMYKYGFTETAGNFQATNFNRGGKGNDAVIALVQCGADVGYEDNATFTPLPDGLPGVCRMFVFNGPQPSRDGSLDQEVVIHELVHGLSSRLLGAGAMIKEWQPAGMGEGWSDFYALAMLSEPKDNTSGSYPTGGYLSYRLGGMNFYENYYFGIRRYPYSRDLAINPLTFKDIDPTQADPHVGVPTSSWLLGSPADEVHNMGEVWCAALFDVWANLVDKNGWTNGTDIALQIVTDGMKLAPADATYLEARDAILQAEQVLTAGDNYPEIWIAFARRGYGYSATCPINSTTIGVVEAFDLPPDVVLSQPDGILELRITPPNLSALITGETNRLSVKVTDSRGVLNATVATTISVGTAPVYKNDGVAPDVQAGDSTYTANYVLPANTPSVTLTLVVSAPGKITSTNLVTYYAVAPPVNDNFAKAVKVSAAGGVFYTSNKRATLETGEPLHGGLPLADHSLWYNYTSATNTTLAIDSGGSDFTAVIGVYTGNSVANLQPVVSAVGSSERLGPYLYLNANAGVTYRIALAGIDGNNVGTVRLKIAPNVFADTNAPSIAVTSPSSGTGTNNPTVVVFTNIVQILGSAVDPDPFASGVREIGLSIGPSSTPGVETYVRGTFDNNFEGPTSTNWQALVGLQPGLNVVRVWAIDFAGNRSAVIPVQVNYRFIDPPNDFLATSRLITNNSGSLPFNTRNATAEVGEPSRLGIPSAKSVWWTFKPVADGILTLTTTNSSFDTLMALYSGGNTGMAGLSLVTENDDDPAFPGGGSTIKAGVYSNQVYQIAVDGYAGSFGGGNLSYSFVSGATLQLVVNSTAGGYATPGNADYASNTVVTLTAFPSLEYQFDRWDGSVSSLANPLTVTVRSNMSVTAHFKLADYTENFESGGLSYLAWVTSGNAPWSVPVIGAPTNVASGSYAARSGVISDNQTSSLKLTADFAAGNGSFAYKVSSEDAWDNLKFFIDGGQIQQWNGEEGWARYAFPITAGTHTLEWRYVKDPSGSAGQDAAFIDNVQLPLVVPKDSTTPALLSLSQQSDGNYVISVTGQANQTYQLQMSTNLVNWQILSTGVAYDGSLQVLDGTSANKPGRYYRAVVP